MLYAAKCMAAGAERLVWEPELIEKAWELHRGNILR